MNAVFNPSAEKCDVLELLALLAVLWCNDLQCTPIGV